MDLVDLIDHDLGKKQISYTARDAILYALAVGADPAQLDLVFERELRVLPAYGCALGLWAVEAAGALGAYDRNYSLHASQILQVHKPMPASGDFAMTGHIRAVWDKGKASLVEIVADSEYFSAGYSIFLPGQGGWGGERGPASPVHDLGKPDWTGSFATWPNQAAIYRLTGDLHPIHIDTKVAQANNFSRPILHGLCTLGIVAREIAQAQDAHPCDLVYLNARLAAPVLPGDRVDILVAKENEKLGFEANTSDAVVLKGGTALFRQESKTRPARAN
jgi:acyl dehydratase